MAPSATQDDSFAVSMPPRSPKSTRSIVHQRGRLEVEASDTNGNAIEQYCFARNLHTSLPTVGHAEGVYIYTADGRRILDMAAGAAVSCLGHGNKRVIAAGARQDATGITYIASPFWKCQVVEDACKELVRGTDGKMSLVFPVNSGSEAMEAALKMAFQYYTEKDKLSKRHLFISREHSYHGNTMGSLGVSGHKKRREPYEHMLPRNVFWVSSCNQYRQQLEGETDEQFVQRKVQELDAKFIELGSHRVAAFIVEPISGAALGCVPPPPGYLRAMKEVCERHGSLMILDEVMSGMGRCGSLHVWQDEGFVPDIQTIAKGLGGGYEACAAVLASEKVAKRFRDGTGVFVHGQTYQAFPKSCAAILEVQKIIREDNLLANVRIQGTRLERGLRRALQDHPNVGDIRGRGLFWGIEFVKDKVTKEPFDLDVNISNRLWKIATSDPFNMTIYPCIGSADGYKGDHIILAPPYIITPEQVDYAVETITEVVNIVFQEVNHN